ncbi:hypothetical protein [Novosphingobium mangrovi (ex Huang et al. 2023)]|uniref:Uncharacterized protein n=1 Tax=Novosphingobium mangrovi (ex Huang et al. 2023) TaxID=2976432 RepID=A0ABT2I8U0_9SPHN|nr:hypothetical protein [Novosphingobium mangrovi (ex Huang et al. 2023)]MCT2401227.1 hypothetical protein [Novosphingobium mangrovi (ex Huang et al. 2023)]
MATPGKWRTGDKSAASYPTRQPTRWLRNLVLLVLVLAVAALAWSWKDLRERALVGSAYGARVGCVCRYVSQRPLKSCEGDLDVAGLGRVAGLASLSEDEETKTITAGIPLLAHQKATFDERNGCLLEPWDD